MIDSLQKAGLTEWLKNPDAGKSSRIIEAIKVVNKHKTDRIVVFTNFRTTLNVAKYYVELETKRKCLTISSTMSMNKRDEVIQEFQQSTDAILFLTFDIAGCGLNLQCSNTMLLLSTAWNSGKTDQAIGRILRLGQRSTVVNIYHFLSNTAIEKCVFTKQFDKKICLKELLTGAMNSKVATMKTKDIVEFVNMEDNISIVNKIY